jgi:hypothetical protein
LDLLVWRIVTMKFSSFPKSLAVVVVVGAGTAGGAAACGDDGVNHGKAGETAQASWTPPPDPELGPVVPLDELVDGRTYAQWGAQLWKEMYAEPRANNPIEALTGEFCDQRQPEGNVWFLHRNFGGHTVRSCVVPKGKYLFAALVDAFEDYPCPSPTFQPSPGQSLYDFLKNGNANARGTERLLDPFTILNAEVNGTPIPNVNQYRSTSTELENFTADISWKPIDPCVTGGPQQAVAAGYWLMLRPLPPGPHELHFRAERPDCAGCVVEVTWHLTVEGNGKPPHEPDPSECDGGRPDHDDGAWNTFDAALPPPRTTP